MGVTGAGPYDVGILVRILEGFYGIWNDLYFGGLHASLEPLIVKAEPAPGSWKSFTSKRFSLRFSDKFLD